MGFQFDVEQYCSMTRAHIVGFRQLTYGSISLDR